MNDKEELYEAFGELIYVVAKVDGLIDGDEVSKITKILDNHPWASNIKWSFNYEWLRDEPAEEIYKKAIARCLKHGPAEEYVEMLDVMKQITDASEQTYRSEQKIINSFSKDLVEQFQKDIDKHIL
jgi:uncharacterized tellurite resistance protein B-like protein